MFDSRGSGMFCIDPASVIVSVNWSSVDMAARSTEAVKETPPCCATAAGAATMDSSIDIKQTNLAILTISRAFRLPIPFDRARRELFQQVFL